ncbi:MAG: hypothetical protein AAF488_14600 [Planctomycetota bacterium]
MIHGLVGNVPASCPPRSPHPSTNDRGYGRVVFLGLALLLSSMSVYSICVLTPTMTPLAIPSVAAATVDGIDFYGACVEGDTFVWCIDRSCSMGWGGIVDGVKAEVSAALLQLSPPQEFSVITFSSSVNVLATDPIEANPANIDVALGFVSSYQVGGGTCLVDGVVAAIEVAELGTGAPTLMVIGDGAEFCSGSSADPAGVVNAIALAAPAMPIHTFYVGANPGGIPTFQAISDAFGGFFVDTNQPLDWFRRGDVTQDGSIDVADPVALLAAGFIPGTDPPACLDAADADDNGEVEFLVDAISLLQLLFVPGSDPLSAPGNSCGSDPTPDGLLCSGVCP